MRQLNLLIAALFLISPFAANADLIDQGDTTLDTNTGLEWLDINLTRSVSYVSFISGYGGYAADGYVLADQSQICGLFGSLGDSIVDCFGNDNVTSENIALANTEMMVGFLGQNPLAAQGGAFRTVGFFDAGQLGSGSVGWACINRDQRNSCGFGGVANGGTRVLQFYTTGSADGFTGLFLVRQETPPSHPVPEPGTLALLGIGLVGMGAARRRKKV